MSDDGEQASLDEVVEEYAEEDGESKDVTEGVDAGKLQTAEESPVEGWELRRLGDVFTLEYGDNLTEDERDGGQYPVYGSNGQVGSHSEPYVDDAGIIIGRKGSIGEAEFSEEPFHPIDTTYYISDDKTAENLRFVYYLLENVQLSRLNAASAIPGLNRNDAYSLKGLVPPLPEQRKIASVLYNVDEAIRTAEEIIERTKRVKKGVRERLLTTGTGDAETEEVRFGPVRSTLPENWKKKKIDEIYADRNLGTTERGTDEEGRTVPLTKMGNLEFGSWNWDEVEKISRDEDFIDEYRLEKGDLLFNTRNTPELVGKTAVWDFDYDAVYDNNLLRLRFNENIYSGHFVNYYLSSEVGRRQLRARVHGTTSVAAIYWKDLKKTEVPVPPREEQKEIVETLRDLDDVIVENEEYADPLHRLKRALMQDLLTGEVRTKGRDIDVLSEVEAHG